MTVNDQNDVNRHKYDQKIKKKIWIYYLLRLFCVSKRFKN